MPRILKRPMFRSGGSTNEGIMHGLKDRTGYEHGDIVKRARELTPEMAELLGEFTPKAKFNMGQMGANLVSNKFAGEGLFRNIVGSGTGPYSQFATADDKRDAAIQGSAVKLGLGQAMSEAKNINTLKQSNTYKQAREMVDLGLINKETDKPYTFEEAYQESRYSQGDVFRSSPEQQIQNRVSTYYRGDDQGEIKATFDVLIKPKLERKVGQELVAGTLPKGEMARKRKLRQTQEGAYFFDLARNPPQVVRFDGVDENGNPQLATLDQETFAPISTTTEPRTNLDSSISQPPYDDSLDNPMA
jgi:hypothetical protein